MENSKNKGFRNSFLIGLTIICLTIIMGGGIIYSVISHANFEFLEKKGNKKELFKKQEAERSLDEEQPEVKIIYDTIRITEHCKKEHCNAELKKQSLDSIGIFADSLK